MRKYRIFIVESVFAEDFYNNDREGQVVEAIARVLHWESEYKIALDTRSFRRAIKAACNANYHILHLSCHGGKTGIQLTDETEISWNELADCFQKQKQIPAVLIISSCVGGDRGVARAFQERRGRPDVIFGSEATNPCEITFPGACIAWPILFTSLATQGMTREAFKDAVAKMNRVTKHKFVYRRWDDVRYRRFPSRS